MPSGSVASIERSDAVCKRPGNVKLQFFAVLFLLWGSFLGINVYMDSATPKSLLSTFLFLVFYLKPLPKAKLKAAIAFVIKAKVSANDTEWRVEP